jgi:hypothetical protein
MRFKCIKEFPDGSAKFDITLSKKDEQLYRSIAKLQKRKYSMKFVKELTMEAITNATKGAENA